MLAMHLANVLSDERLQRVLPIKNSRIARSGKDYDPSAKSHSAKDEDPGSKARVKKTSNQVCNMSLNLWPSIFPLVSGLSTEVGVVLVILLLGTGLLYKKYKKRRQ